MFAVIVIAVTNNKSMESMHLQEHNIFKQWSSSCTCALLHAYYHVLFPNTSSNLLTEAFCLVFRHDSGKSQGSTGCCSV